LAFGVDLAARDSATVGGLVATNAGGIHTVRHGSMRAQVLGVEAVLAGGDVLRRWLPLRKDNVGYDLPGLLTGSEGTLAVITGVLVRLVARPRRTAVCVAAVDSVEDALALAARVEESGEVLRAVELMTAEGVELVVAAGARRPMSTASSLFVLIETEGSAAALAEQIAAGDVIDAVVDDGPAPALWELRELHTETIARSTSTPVVKLDVSVPLPAVGALIDDAAQVAGEFGARSIPFGHLGDGNLHVNLLDVAPADADAVVHRVLQTVVDLGGSISAEHGVGRAKASSVGLERSAVDLATMRAIKSALDPDGLLNPGVLFAD
ncbi:MAG: FAD-binding oxidoreductase, partial [Gordonia sp. (in: high G+C Gram-positive bacteria)]